MRLIDKAADVGGTWYWNRYPGIACDVESYVYMPLLEELGYIPTEKYAKGAEIFAHCRRIAEHYDLYRDACLQTEVTRDPLGPSELSRWVISTNRGDAMRARFVSMANGYLQKPKLPGIAGIETSAGTPSTPAGGTTTTPAPTWPSCPDKRVGIIGTGATAIQCVPHLAQSAQQLFVFQRTPSTGRCARQPADRSGVVGRPRSTAGSAAASRTSSCSPPVARPTRIWSTTRGRASSRSSS